ncbi:MAG: molecular chaperone HtpG [Candidatus Hinthialibacter antarcticus]|nr:molecular chaperone HtpG [Candidatus Hinthialibacter antarcticus]
MNQDAQTPNLETREFQADVKQVLDIVIHSLYTHREIFIRELISNAADALEKLRYEQLQNQDIADAELPLEIRINVDEEKKTFTISDAGIGLSEEEAVKNLGSIAHSGSREFIEKLKESGGDAQLIGQFGVGFYSVFMAADRVTVQSRSAQPDAGGIEWRSEGTGSYQIGPAPALSRGTRITAHLREDAYEFASKDRVKNVIEQYSNFVPFDIYLNDEKVNTVQAVWTRNKNEISDDEYNEFFKFIGNEHTEPSFRLHFSADAPLQINALLFVPQQNFEKMGFGKLDPGVNLYCKKVLIQEQSKTILPDWLRFVKGVVDSEDLPLNISRESMQNNALVTKLKTVVTKRFIKFLNEEANKDAEAYAKFWEQFGGFIKEGVAVDLEHRDALAPLLRFESSNEEAGKRISLIDYAARMKTDQNKIYYAFGVNRKSIEAGPYMEAFRASKTEVLFLHDPADEFVLNGLREFDGKAFVSADQADLDLPEPKEDDNKDGAKGLDKEQTETLAGWFKSVLGERVGAVRESKRLVDSPAILVNSDSYFTTSMQRIMKSMNQEMPAAGTHNLEINPKHPLMIRLSELKKENAEEAFLTTAAEQIFDAARLAAGLETEPQTLIQRSHAILEKALGAKK